MIILLFSVLVAFSVILVVAGYLINNDDAVYLRLSGYVLLLLVGLSLLLNPLSVEQGFNESVEIDYNYGDNYTVNTHWHDSIPAPSVKEINLFHINSSLQIVKNYVSPLSTLENASLALFILLLSIFGIINCGIQVYSSRKEDKSIHEKDEGSAIFEDKN